MNVTTHKHFRLLAAHLGVTSPEVLQQLDLAVGNLPRTCAIGVEVTFDAGSAIRVDAIAGARGERFEHEALRAWACALSSPEDSGGPDTREIGDRVVVAGLADTLLGSLGSIDGSYGQLWLEADGHESSNHSPAVICEHRDDLSLTCFELPFGRQLHEISPLTVARMKRVPFATHASMIGWMPGRDGAPKGAGRLYWDQRTISRLGEAESDIFEAWQVQTQLRVLAESAREAGLDCAVAVNVTEDRWVCDGLEVAPRERANPQAWKPFDEWATDRLPLSAHWGYSLGAAFEDWDERQAIATLPDHILGSSVTAPDETVPVVKARPSHIKLSVRDGELRVKVYAGLEYALTSLQG